MDDGWKREVFKMMRKKGLRVSGERRNEVFMEKTTIQEVFLDNLGTDVVVVTEYSSYVF